MESNACDAQTEDLCVLCQVMPVEPGKKVCSTCWQLAPGWVKRQFMSGRAMDWSQLLGSPTED